MSATIIPFPIRPRAEADGHDFMGNMVKRIEKLRMHENNRQKLEAAIAERYSGRAQMSQSQMDRTAGMAIAFLNSGQTQD